MNWSKSCKLSLFTFKGAFFMAIVGATFFLKGCWIQKHSVARTGFQTKCFLSSQTVGLPRCKNLWHFFFVFLARAGVWVLFNGLLALLFSLFYVIREFDKFLHWGWAQTVNYLKFGWSQICCWYFIFNGSSKDTFSATQDKSGAMKVQALTAVCAGEWSFMLNILSLCL